MAEQRSFIRNVIIKLGAGVVVGAVLAGTTIGLGFPRVFQAMFFIYGLVGGAVFLLLDAPSMRPMSGVKALIALLVFYIVLSGLYIAGASLWPQYDPEDEKGKIEKLLLAKRKASEQGKAEELLARTKALEEKAKAINERLKGLAKDLPTEAAAGAGGVQPASVPGGTMADAKDIDRLGYEQWQLQECYNCHKLKGEGGKKRGPELDNIGTHMTADQIKEKILDPKAWMAEGFEKEYEKKKMPDKYKELMEDKDVEVLAVWLATFKNSAVNTPKPIKKK
jgi:cytochrome c553